MSELVRARALTDMCTYAQVGNQVPEGHASVCIWAVPDKQVVAGPSVACSMHAAPGLPLAPHLPCLLHDDVVILEAQVEELPALQCCVSAGHGHNLGLLVAQVRHTVSLQPATAVTAATCDQSCMYCPAHIHNTASICTEH
jgi:hypothetical protein